MFLRTMIKPAPMSMDGREPYHDQQTAQTTAPIREAHA